MSAPEATRWMRTPPAPRRFELQLFAGEKSQPPTARRRTEARKKGQVFQSRELSSGLVLLGVVLVLQATQGSFLAKGEAVVAAFLGNLSYPLSISSVFYLYRMGLLAFLGLTFPVLLAVTLLTLAGGLFQVGFLFSLEPLAPKFSRINPLEGLKRIFSRRVLVQMVKDLLKLLIIGAVAYAAIQTNPEMYPSLSQMDPRSAFLVVAQRAGNLALEVAMLFLFLGVADYGYQWYEYQQSLKMSKEEVKEELKETEGQPEVKRRIRERQRRLALARMMQAVPKADVIITNPTHYAVAIAYRPGEMGAPRVVAKGQGFVAQRIREIGQAAGVTIYPYPTLAQDLYRQVEVGDEVPVAFYQAVAEVLAFVYRLKHRAIG